MSKERPPASKNLRSFQTAEKGDLESACPWGAEIGPTPKADLECGRYVAAFFPRRHVASFQSADMSAHSKPSARRLAQKLLVRPARAEGDPHGRPLPTCDLVKATSLLMSVLLLHNVNRLWDRAGPQFLHTLGTSEPCSAENRLSFSTERDRF